MTAQRVSDSNVPPRNAAGYLAMRWSTDGLWSYGSGAQIDSTHILTCSHNLVDPVTDPPPIGNATAIKFYPAYNQARTSDPPAGGLDVAVGFFTTAFLNGEDMWDVAICRLAAPRVITPYFTPTVTGEEIVGTDITLTGYPGPRRGEMWEDVDQVAGVEITTNTLLYTNDTWSGDSGAPTWTYDSVDDVVKQHGIHVSRQAQELRRAVLITDLVRQWIAFALSQPTGHGTFYLQGLPVPS